MPAPFLESQLVMEYARMPRLSVRITSNAQVTMVAWQCPPTF